MKTYYGQMTKEQVHGNLIKFRLSDFREFCEMLRDAGAKWAGGGVFPDNKEKYDLASVNPEWGSLSFATENNARRITERWNLDRCIWLPESERPSSSWHECYCDNNIGGLYIGMLGAKKYILDSFGGNAISEGFHSFFLKGGELFGSIGAKQKPVSLMKEAKKECGIKSQLAEAIAKRDKRKVKAQKAVDKLQKAVESLNQAEKEVQHLIAELEKDVESIGGISCKIAETEKPEVSDSHEIPEGVDVDDPKTWRAGDIAVCVIPFAGNFAEGEEHAVLEILGGNPVFKADSGLSVTATASKFRFVRRP